MASKCSISLAADDPGLTPPAVHSQTEAMAGLTLAVNRIDSLRIGMAGTVGLGAVSTGKVSAPGLVARIEETRPDIEVILGVGNRDLIIGALEDGAIDLSVIGRLLRHPAVTTFLIGDPSHVLIAPPDHRLVGPHRVTAAGILSKTIISREAGSGTHIMAKRIPDRIGEGQPNEELEMGTIETIKQAVIAGLGTALIPLHTVTEELRSRRLVAVTSENLPIMRKWYVLHRQDQLLAGAIQTFL